MPEITVWTKQNSAVLDQLARDGRFIADEGYIRAELEDTADIMLFIYGWLTEHMPNASLKPHDVVFPVWVSLTREATMKPEPGYAVLELRLMDTEMILLDTAKWTRITNYSYIPSGEADAREHSELMERLGISDAAAVMTQFYPEVRQMIISSWDRLFDDTISLGSDSSYGLIWEVRKEWVQQIIV
jgi:hypothetical protein